MAGQRIYSSAGHHLGDPGAIGIDGRKESTECIIFRDLVNAELHRIGISPVSDDDRETLGQYLGRISPNEKDVVVEVHFNAFNGKASGVEVLISDNASHASSALAGEIAGGFAKIMGITNRGVKKESQSARGRLALMRERGTVCLIEICFIDNRSDMRAYDNNRDSLARFLAQVISRYDIER